MSPVVSDEHPENMRAPRVSGDEPQGNRGWSITRIVLPA